MLPAHYTRMIINTLVCPYTYQAIQVVNITFIRYLKIVSLSVLSLINVVVVINNSVKRR